MGAAKRFVQNPGKNAICYYRYSSDAQRDASIEQQQEEAQRYANAHGIHIVKEYVDRAVSGTRDDRVGYNMMLYEVEMLRPAYLILWKTDRLSRDRYDSVIAKKRLRDCGVKIVYTGETVPDSEDGMQGIVEAIYEAMADQFIQGHRKNVMRGLNYNAERCLYNGIRLFGYIGEVDKPYAIDPNTAPIVKQIFQDYADGMTQTNICKWLRERGVKSVNGKDFTTETLRKMLSNNAYTGVYKYGDYTTPDGMPRIIDDELFERVQARIKANQRGGKGAIKKNNPEAEIADYWLSGHIYCGICGDTMQGISGTSKSGTKHYYYSCKNRRQHKCTMHNKQQELLEKIVLDVLQNVVHNSVYRLMIAEKCYAYYQAQNDDGGVYEASIKDQLKETETKIENIMKAVEAGMLTPTTVERMKALEAAKSRLQDALLAEQNRQKFQIKLEDIVKYLDNICGDLNNMDNRKLILDEYIHQIIVDEEKMVIVFHYTDERQEYPLSETAQAIDNRQRIMSMLDEGTENVPIELLNTVLPEREDPDFFP